MLPKNYKYKPLTDNLTVAPSKIEGLGLFARKNISANTILGVSHIEDKRFENGFIRTPLGGFYNYSENPNCTTKKGLTDGIYYLMTIKDINIGEELTTSYNLINKKI